MRLDKPRRGEAEFAYIHRGRPSGEVINAPGSGLRRAVRRVLVDHTDGQVRHPKSQGNNWRDPMGAYCLCICIRSCSAIDSCCPVGAKWASAILWGSSCSSRLSSPPRPPADVVVRRPLYERAGMRATGRTSCVPVAAAGTRSVSR